MKNQPTHKNNIMLWWIAIFSIVLSGTLFFLLKSQAEYDSNIAQTRLFILVIGFLISGTCVIIATAGRWFISK